MYKMSLLGSSWTCHMARKIRDGIAMELVAWFLVYNIPPKFTVQENTAEFAAVNASPPADIGYVYVPYCSAVVQ